MKLNHILYVLLFSVIFFSCENSEDISKNFDHEVPSYKVLTDSIKVKTNQEVDIKVEIEDNAGLSKLVFIYSNWSILESISLSEENFPKSYLFERKITVPADAEKEWEEEIILNDGSKKSITQTYHELIIEATDINMNKRKIPIYISVQ